MQLVKSLVLIELQKIGASVSDQRVEKISECFVYWRNADGRTLGVNTLSAKDASLFISHTAPTTTPITTMVQHNVIAQASLALLALIRTRMELRSYQEHVIRRMSVLQRSFVTIKTPGAGGTRTLTSS